MAIKERELAFDFSSDRIGWNLRTSEVDVSCEFGNLVKVLGNVPLSVQEAAFLFPHLGDWIVGETQKHVETFGEHFPVEMDKLRTELTACR